MRKEDFSLGWIRGRGIVRPVSEPGMLRPAPVCNAYRDMKDQFTQNKLEENVYAWLHKTKLSA